MLYLGRTILFKIDINDYPFTPPKVKPFTKYFCRNGYTQIIGILTIIVIAARIDVSTDTWKAGDLTFTIYSPVQAIPDPKKATDEELKFALVPAVIAELRVDNSKGKQTRRAFFGYEGSDPYSSMRRIDDTSEVTGIGQGRLTSIVSNDQTIKSALHFSMEDILLNPLEENWTFGLGKVGAIIMDTHPGEIKTFRFAICFHRTGFATAGLDTTYLYTKYFKNIEA